jgi:glyoxylase-like metal-dependent hydrolase (beta-lactamase superfamily II)
VTVRLAAQFRLGALHVAALSDGIGRLWARDWFPGVAEEEWARAMGLSKPSQTLPVNFGSFLVRGGGHTVLIDTGNGPRSRTEHEHGAGLLDRMRDLGVAPEDVDTVLLTHFHGDHVGWNTDEERGGAVTFPAARFWLHQADLRHLDRPEAEGRPGDLFSRSKLWPLRDAGRLETFEGEHSPLPGLRFLPAPGHTPGHCAILVESQGERLIITGDAAPTVAHLEHPQWTPVYDLDGPRAVESRRALATRAIEERAIVTGGHFPILTVGRLEHSGDAVRWRPVAVDEVTGPPPAG